MADINCVVLIGRLTRDAELRYLSSGRAVCKFSIAVNRRKKISDTEWGEEASFFDVTLWGPLGEAIIQYLVKGKQVSVQGELQQSRWEQDGQPRSKVEIIASSVQLLGSGGGGGGYSSTVQNNNEAGNQRSAYQQRSAPRKPDYSDQFDSSELDTVPF